jgi:hypothetical protein
LLASAAIVAAALGLHGAAAAAAPRADVVPLKAVPHSKVGRVDGTRAFVALAFDGRRLSGYVCDGTARRAATIAQWFEAGWDGRSPLTLVRKGIELRIDRVFADGHVRGHVQAFSGPHAFTVAAAPEPAGLQVGTDATRRVRATWIVLGDGSIRGAMADPRPRRCRPVQVTLTDGTTTIVTVCKMG